MSLSTCEVFTWTLSDTYIELRSVDEKRHTCAFTHTHTHTYTHTHTHKHIRARTHIRIHTDTHLQTAQSSTYLRTSLKHIHTHSQSLLVQTRSRENILKKQTPVSGSHELPTQNFADNGGGISRKQTFE